MNTLTKPKHSNTSNMFQNFTVLIVDDCQVSSLFLTQLLEQIGLHSVDQAISYQQAIKYCSKKNYSLLFIDYHLEQALNGSELYDLLRDKGFIQPYTRVITVSGDNTTQTVLSTLSKGNGDYLCKPISKSSLTHKVLSAYNEFSMFKQLYSLMNEKKYAELQKKTISLAKEKNINELDRFLINFLIESDPKKLLDLCQHSAFLSRKNYILAQLEVQSELKLLAPEQLIQKASNLCSVQPLFSAALDFLANLQIKQAHYEDALLTSIKALSLTPSVPFRALRTLKLALTCNNKNEFLKASHLLANHLPVADQNWCTYIAECFTYFDDYIKNCQSESDKNQLILEQKNFVRRSEYRLTSKQKTQLSILYNFSVAKRLIESGDIIQAKQNTLKVIEPFFDNLHHLNTTVLIELLYLLTFYGDLWLIERVNNVLKTKHHFTEYCLDSLQLLKNDIELKERLSQLSCTITEGDYLLSSEPKNALSLYQTGLCFFPYSSELCIGLLEAYIKLSLDNPIKASIAISLVKDMPLSQQLIERRDAALMTLHAHSEFVSEQSNDLKNQELITLKNKTLTKPSFKLELK